MAERIEVIVDGTSRGYVTALSQADAATRRFGATTTAEGKRVTAFNAITSQQGRNLQAVGRMGLYAGGALAGAFAYGLYQGVKAGADFEKQMARVQAVTQAADADMNKLRKQALELGRDTKFSAGEAAEAMYELASAGFSVKETQDALPGTLDLAAASNIELAAAAEISSNALRGFKLDADESTHVADVLAQSVNSSSLEMTDLQMTMKYLGPVAKATGQDLEEMVAAVSLMGDAGIKGEQAGTSLRAGLLRLVRPIGQTKKELIALGLSAEDLTGPNGLLPLPELIGVLEEAMEDLSKSERASALSALFGQEAVAGMLTVVDAGPEKLEKLSDEFRKSDGAAQDAAETMNKTVAGAFENLTGSLETVQISLYERFQKPMREALLEGADLVNREGKEIADWLDAIVNTDEFKNADLAGRLAILGDALEDVLIDGVNAALPVIAESAGKAGVTAFESFVNAFTDSGLLGKAVLGGVLVSKLGLGGVIFRRAGVQAGAEFTEGFALTTAAVGAAPGAGGRMAAPMAAAGAAAGTQFGRRFERTASGVIVPASTNIGQKASAQVNAGMAAGLTSRARSLGSTALGIGKGVLGVNLALGIVSGITSEAPTIEGRLQDVMSNLSLGLLPSWRKQADEAAAKMAAALEDGISRVDFADAASDNNYRVQLAGAEEYAEFSERTAEILERGLIPQLRSLSLGNREAEVATEAMRGALERMRDEGDLTDEAFEQMSSTLDGAWGAFEKGKAKTNEMRELIKQLRITWSDSVDEISDRTEENMRKIERSFGRHSQQGKELLVANYGAAEKAVQTAMDNSQISTENGLDMIEDLIRKRLALVGVKGPDAEKIIVASGGGKTGLQRGGQPKEGYIPGPGKSGDRHHVVVEDGEYVLNREAVKGIGVQNLDRINHGLMARFQEGGIVALGRQLQREGYEVGENPAFGGVTPGVHDPGGYHPTGQAIDVNDDSAPFGFGSSEMQSLDHLYSRLKGMAGVVELLWRTTGHYDHLHVAMAQGASGAIGRGARLGQGPAFSLNLPEFSSPYAAFTPAAEQLSLMSTALEKEIAGRMGAIAGAGGAITAGIGSGAWQDAVRAIAKKRGWSVADWTALIMGESGGDPTAVNPSSGAFGIGQFLGATLEAYAPYGATSHDPVKQIEAMAKYISDRYGNPTNAYHQWLSRSPHWYAEGGLIGLVGDSHTSAEGSFGDKWKVNARDGRGSTEGLEVLRGMLSADVDAVVFDLATNDYAQPGTLRSNLDKVRAMLDGRGLALVNTFLSGGRHAGVNDAIADFGAKDALADFFSYASGQGDVLRGDGIHFTAEAYARRKELVRAAGNKALDAVSRGAGGNGSAADPPLPDPQVGTGTGPLPARIGHVKAAIKSIEERLANDSESTQRINEIKGLLDGTGLGRARRRDLKHELAKLEEQRLSSDQRERMRSREDILEERLGELRSELRKRRADRAEKLKREGVRGDIDGRIAGVSNQGAIDLMLEQIELAERDYSRGDSEAGSDYGEGEVAALKQMYWRDGIGPTGLIQLYEIKRDSLIGFAQQMRNRIAHDDALLKPGSNWLRKAPKWQRDALRENRRKAQALLGAAEDEYTTTVGLTGFGGDLGTARAALGDIAVATPDDSGAELDRQRQLTDLANERALEAMQRANLSQMELGTISEFFRNMPGLPFLGAFAAGTGGRRVGNDGIAYLHRDEIVTPDPEGAHGSQFSASGANPPSVTVVLRDRAGELVELIDARVDGRQAQITKRVDRELGRRGRQRAYAPG